MLMNYVVATPISLQILQLAAQDFSVKLLLRIFPFLPVILHQVLQQVICSTGVIPTLGVVW